MLNRRWAHLPSPEWTSVSMVLLCTHNRGKSIFTKELQALPKIQLHMPQAQRVWIGRPHTPDKYTAILSRTIVWAFISVGSEAVYSLFLLWYYLPLSSCPHKCTCFDNRNTPRVFIQVHTYPAYLASTLCWTKHLRQPGADEPVWGEPRLILVWLVDILQERNHTVKLS